MKPLLPTKSASDPVMLVMTDFWGVQRAKLTESTSNPGDTGNQKVQNLKEGGMRKYHERVIPSRHERTHGTRSRALASSLRSRGPSGCGTVCDGLPDSTRCRTTDTASYRDAEPAAVDLRKTSDPAASGGVGAH